MFIYPVTYPMPEGPLELQGRIQQLELALSMSLELFQKLTERLEAKLGPDFLGEELSRLATAATPAQDEVRAIDAMLKQDQLSQATRRLRELAAVTWDQAHAIIARWESTTFDQKVRMIQTGQWIHALRAQPENASPS